METCSGREPSANTATELGEPEDREMRKRPILGDGERKTSKSLETVHYAVTQGQRKEK